MKANFEGNIIIQFKDSGTCESKNDFISTEEIKIGLINLINENLKGYFKELKITDIDVSLNFEEDVKEESIDNTDNNTDINVNSTVKINDTDSQITTEPIVPSNTTNTKEEAQNDSVL